MRKAFFLTSVAALPVAAFCIGLYFTAYAGLPAAVPIAITGDPLISYDPVLGFVPTPNARSHVVYPKVPEFDVYTDARGARISAPGQTAPTGTLIIGCSFSWGHGMPGDKTYASLLGGTNLSFASYGTTMALQMLRKNRDLRPKLVIYGMIATHLNRNVSRCSPTIYPFCLDQAYADESRIYEPATNGVRRAVVHQEYDAGGLDPLTWVLHGLDIIRGQQIVNSPASPERQEATMRFLFGEMKRTTDEMGAKLLIVFMPTAHQPVPESILRAAKGLPFLDVTEAFRGQDAYWPDGHPSEIGHAIVAREVKSYLPAE